jgi:hypothetical protein
MRFSLAQPFTAGLAIDVMDRSPLMGLSAANGNRPGRKRLGYGKPPGTIQTPLKFSDRYFCASGVVRSGFDGSQRFGLQLFGLIMGRKCIDDGGEGSVHYLIELMNRQADAMIADAVLFEVVGADLF